MNEIKTISILLPVLRKYGWMAPAIVGLGIVASLAETVGLSLFVPLFQSVGRGTSSPLDSNSLPGFFPAIFRRLPAENPVPYIVGLILAMTICKALLTFVHSWLAARTSARVTHSLRSQVFSKVLGISQCRLEETGMGRLVNLLATDTWHTSDAIGLWIGLVVNLCSIAVFSALLITLSWKLTIAMIAGVALVSTVIRGVTSGARRSGQDGLEANTALSDQMIDAIEGVREIQMFNLRENRQRVFDAQSDRVRSIFLRLDLLHRTAAPLSEVLYVALLLALLLVGIATHGSVPSIIVFLLVMYRLQPQIRQLDSARLSLLALTTPVEEVMRFLNEPAGAEEPFGARPSIAGLVSAQTAGTIEFEDVCFAYNDDAEFRMKNLSLRIPLGKTTGIVGRSGSGKSTLIRLLCGFYTADSGTIRVEGRSFAQLDAQTWRNRIAWVSQDAHLFRATIRENIRDGRLDATDEEVFAAAVEADAADFIAQLPDGFDTRIGGGGTELSSGQVQRIALARAFVRKAAILILDEATNSLDSLSEEAIRERLVRTCAQRTIIVISHRLSTVRGADHVIVLDRGAVSEEGAPAELSRQRGFFSRIRELQHAG